MPADTGPCSRQARNPAMAQTVHKQSTWRTARSPTCKSQSDACNADDPSPDLSDIHQMLKEVCAGQAQIEQRLNAVERQYSESPVPRAATQPDQAPANDYPTMGSRHTRDPPRGRSLSPKDRTGPSHSRPHQSEEYLTQNSRPHPPIAANSTYDEGAPHPDHEAEAKSWQDELNALEKGIKHCDDVHCHNWETKNNLLMKIVELMTRVQSAECCTKQ